MNPLAVAKNVGKFTVRLVKMGPKGHRLFPQGTSLGGIGEADQSAPSHASLYVDHGLRGLAVFHHLDAPPDRCRENDYRGDESKARTTQGIWGYLDSQLLWCAKLRAAVGDRGGLEGKAGGAMGEPVANLSHDPKITVLHGSNQAKSESEVRAHPEPAAGENSTGEQFP